MICVRDLTTEYDWGDPFFVKEAKFQSGEISTVIGRNGSGKSTLLRTLVGQKDYEGSILIDDKECRDYKPTERARKVAFLPQDLKSLNIPVRTLAEHGRYPYHGNFRKMTGEDKAAVERALELTGMDRFAHKAINELSGGERQRAYLAMVIAQDSDMILLDEPTTYMDRIYQDSFYKVLRQLADEGKGIIEVCHDIEQSFAYSDRIFLMEDRKLSFSGSPLELAEQENLIRKNFGVALRRTTEEDALYPFSMRK